MVNKLIENVDNEIWRKFTAICKFKDILVGTELTKILKEYVKKYEK